MLLLLSRKEVVKLQSRLCNFVLNFLVSRRACYIFCMVWYGMVWYGMVWYGMVWYGMVWYGMVWYGMVWYGMVWYGMVWYGMVWYGMVWHGTVSYGMVSYGMVSYLTILEIKTIFMLYLLNQISFTMVVQDSFKFLLLLSV